MRIVHLWLGMFAAVFLQTQLQGQSWIRINQLGYLPQSVKVAVLVSKDHIEPTSFTIHDALTGGLLLTSEHIKGFGNYGPFHSTFRLDFSEYTLPGSIYIESDGVRSPVFTISPNVYDGTADFLLRYMRQQRCGYNPFLHDSCHTHDGYIIYHPSADSTHIDVTGGWHDATDYLQYTATSANAVYQMLFAWQQNPHAFADHYLDNGEYGKNQLPDVIDEAGWGLEWLIKMNPDSGEMYNQIADDRDHKGFRLPNHDTVNYGKGRERPVYYCTGKEQGLFQYKNRTTGIASTAGKFASAFAMGSLIMNEFDQKLAENLRDKAIDAWEFGKANPGFCQTAPCVAPYFYEEENWTDDMELAGCILFKLTGERHYLDEAVQYGRQEQVTPWMGVDTSRHYQWYPFLNMGHLAIAESPDPEYREEFCKYVKQGIHRVWNKAMINPFFNGIPGIWCSNNLTVAMLTQCHLYSRLTGDQSYDQMEAALRDWLFGCNPWGTSMIVGLPAFGDYPSDPHSSLSVLNNYPLDGGLVDGPVYYSIFKDLKGISIADGDEYAGFQSHLTVYHDDYADYSTNEPTMDGTACLTYYLSALQQEAHSESPQPSNLLFHYGAIIRGNPDQKKISLVFTGHDQADGFKTVRQTLKLHGIKAAFFLTGDFYRNKAFSRKIKNLQKDGHYLGAHSDKHLLYCNWDKRDSLLVTKNEFIADLVDNYKAMSRFGITSREAPFFLPPYEWYNDSIAAWCAQYGLKLVNFTPGTSSNQDWTYPALGKKYINSDTIFNRILIYESTNQQGLNGFILLTHPGTDPRRPDKFYNRLDELITELKSRGYTFVTLEDLIH